MARSSTAPSTTPFIDYLKVPRLPIPVALDRLSIGKLALAPPVLGENVVATVEGGAELAEGRAHVALDLHRIDSSAGNILLAMEIAGDTPVLSLQLDAAEPTGLLLDRLLARTDQLPLTLSVNGTGPLADWHGRMNASAGTSAHLAADLTLAAADETILGDIGHCAVCPAAPDGNRAADRRPGRALHEREIWRRDRRRFALRRDRSGHLDGQLRDGRPGKSCCGGSTSQYSGPLDVFGRARAAARRLGCSHGIGDRNREPAIARAEFVERRSPPRLLRSRPRRSQHPGKLGRCSRQSRNAHRPGGNGPDRRAGRTRRGPGASRARARHRLVSCRRRFS